MSAVNKEPGRKYTYADYLTWTDEESWELIDGTAHNMSPAPSPKHQSVLGELITEFTVYLRGKTCRAFAAPFDVRLFSEGKSDDEVDHVVQPDLSVVCDSNKIDNKGCKGSPDLVIEVLSPSTSKMDKWIKFKLYERAKVREYWIVDPFTETIEVYLLQSEQFVRYGVFSKDDRVKINIFEDLEIDLNTVFQQGADPL
jgi:Uma2 family endonuclease